MDGKEKSLPKPEPELPKPQIDFPELEKEITSKSTLAFQGEALEPVKKNQTLTKKLKRKIPLGKILVAGIVILITLLAFGLIAYLLMNQNKSQAINSYDECVAAGYPVMESYPEQCAANNQTFTRELTPEEQLRLKNPDPTSEEWITYVSNEFNIEFKYPPTYEIIEKTNETISLGFRDSNNTLFPYLTITKFKSVDPETLETCSLETLESQICLDSVISGYQEEEITETVLDGVSSVSFITTEGRHTLYYIVQTTENPLIELKMNVAGGGLGTTFEHMLSTFQFTQ